MKTLKRVMSLVLVMALLVSVVTVKDVKAASSSFKFGKDIYYIETGKTEKTYLIAAFSENYQIESVEYNMINEKVATVSTDGTITAVQSGIATIEATVKYRKVGDDLSSVAKCDATIIVRDPVKHRTIKPEMSHTKLTVAVGNVNKLSVYNQTGAVKKWKSSNKKVVKVKNGKITARKKGKAVISCVCDGHKLKCVVKVKKNEKKYNKTVSASFYKTTIKKIYFKKNQLRVRLLIKNTSSYKIERLNYATFRIIDAFGTYATKNLGKRAFNVGPNKSRILDVCVSKKKSLKKKINLASGGYKLSGNMGLAARR